MDNKMKNCYIRRKKYDELTLASDFLFCKIMQKPDICKEALERILGKKLSQIICTNSQQTIDLTYDGRGIRLDVKAIDMEGVAYDIEMQCIDTKELPQRSRFYQSLIDQDLLERGDDYEALSNTVIIFVCTFDLFGKGLGKYTFHPYADEDKKLQLEDGSCRIFMNTKGKADTPELQHFLDYLNGISVQNDQFVDRLQVEVDLASKNADWREEYMKISMREKYLENHFKKIGLEEGRAEGRQEERERSYYSFLNLIQNGALTEEDVLRVVDDPDEFLDWLQKQK